MGAKEDEAAWREALAVVLEAGSSEPRTRSVALPRVLSREVARRLEAELAARGFVGARYRDEPREWGDLWDRLETVMGLDREEPRVEWDSRRDAGAKGERR